MQLLGTGYRTHRARSAATISLQLTLITSLSYLPLLVLSSPGCHAVVAAPFLLLLLSVALPEQGSAQSPNGQVNGFISFSVTQLVVDENAGASFTTVQLPLIREVGTSGTVLATVDVSSICNSIL